MPDPPPSRPEEVPELTARRKSANGRSSIYLGGDGKWHGRITMGVRDDGKPDRRHCEGKTQAEVTAKVRAFEKERDQGRVRKPGQRWKVGTWLDHWVKTIAAPPTVSENTQAGYEVDVRKHLVPGVGAHWLDKLDAEHLEKLYANLLESGLSAGTVNHIHRTVRASLNEAVRRGHIGANPALIAKAPPLDEEQDIEPYEVEEIRKLLEVAASRRNSARWAIALALGLRQGEALGLQWSDVDLDKGTMRVRRGRLRPKYEHGCGDTCGRKPGYCPQRRNTRQATRRVKSKAGKRTIGLPAQLVTLLQEHRAQQDAEQAAARQLWQDEGWVFASPTGGAHNPNTDYHEWKALLKEASVRESRLHDARHTAATVLLLLEVPLRTVMSIMGWSSVDMVARYQHITDAIRQKVAGQVDQTIWQTTSTGQVTVRREALAVILPVVDIGLAHSDAETLADLEEAIAHLRVALADGGPNSS
jgi:integrase